MHETFEMTFVPCDLSDKVFGLLLDCFDNVHLDNSGWRLFEVLGAAHHHARANRLLLWYQRHFGRFGFVDALHALLKKLVHFFFCSRQ
jgi:hypothetical protein